MGGSDWEGICRAAGWREEAWILLPGHTAHRTASTPGPGNPDSPNSADLPNQTSVPAAREGLGRERKRERRKKIPILVGRPVGGKNMVKEVSRGTGVGVRVGGRPLARPQVKGPCATAPQPRLGSEGVAGAVGVGAGSAGAGAALAVTLND